MGARVGHTTMRFMAKMLVVLLCVAGCSSTADLDDAPVPLGDFNLVHNIAVAPKAQKGPFSRDATEAELVDALTKAADARFGRYSGARNYHFGMSVEGYVLAAPGIPLVLAPKSALIINLTVWDDAKGTKLNASPQTITVLESFGTGAIVGSGYTLSAEEQLTQLSQNAAKAIERYLRKQMLEEGWFTPEGLAPENPAPEAPSQGLPQTAPDAGVVARSGLTPL